MEDPKDDIDRRMESIVDRMKDATDAANKLVANEASLTPQEASTERKGDSKLFRQYLGDTYSVLDYVWNLLYSLFSPGRQQSLVPGFPYTPKGVKVPQDPNQSNHDGQRKYLKDKFKDWDMTTVEQKKLGDIVLSVQPRQMVNSGGALVGKLQYQPYDKEVFAIFRCLRNWETHNSSLHIYSQDSFVEVSQREGTIRLVTGTTDLDQDRCCIYIALDKPLLWVKMPETLSPSISKRDRPVVALIGEIQTVVTKIVGGLLQSAHLPHNETIWNQPSNIQQYMRSTLDLSALNIISTEIKDILCKHGSAYIKEGEMKCMINALRKTTYAKRIFGVRPMVGDFYLIKYEGKDGSKKRLHILSRGNHLWKGVAGRLFPDKPNLVNGLGQKHQNNPTECLRELLQDFLSKRLPDEYTRDWNGLIELFEDLEEVTLAEEIKEAILNKGKNFLLYGVVSSAGGGGGSVGGGVTASAGTTASASAPPSNKEALLSAKPKAGDFSLIKYKGKDGSKKRLHILSRGNHLWKGVAGRLFPDEPNLVNSLGPKHQNNPTECLRELLQDFLSKRLPDEYTRDWNGLIELFEDLEEVALAEEIKEAVLNKGK